MSDTLPTKTTRLERSEYWIEVFDAALALSHEQFHRGHEIIAALIGLGYKCYRDGLEAMVTDLITTVIYVVVPMLLYLLGWVLFNFGRAMVRVPIHHQREVILLKQEQEQKIKGLQAKLDAIEQAKPRLESTGYNSHYPRKIPTGTLTENYKGGFEEAFFAWVRFTNNPTLPEASAVAKSVHATILYVTNEEQIQVCEHGEWWEESAPPPQTPLPLKDIGFTEFGIGVSRRLSIAFKAKSGGFFGFCCHSRSCTGWRFNKLRLREAEYTVKVILQGVGVPQATYVFLLKNPGPGRPLEISGGQQIE
jgi:hypothetical protein